MVGCGASCWDDAIRCCASAKYIWNVVAIQLTKDSDNANYEKRSVVYVLAGSTQHNLGASRGVANCGSYIQL